MLTRFLIWLYCLITMVSNEPSVNTVVKKLNSKVLDTLDEIQEELAHVPTSVFDIGMLDGFLYKSIESRFNSFEQIDYTLDFYCKGLGEQLNDPLVPKPFEDPKITFSDNGKKVTMLCYFLTQNGKDVSVASTLREIQSKVEILALLYTQIINHSEIDEYIAPYLERRMYVFLVELRDYVVNIKTLGKTHEKTNDDPEYPKVARSR